MLSSGHLALLNFILLLKFMSLFRFLSFTKSEDSAQIPSSVLTASGSMGMISARCFQAPLYEISEAKISSEQSKSNVFFKNSLYRY